MFDRSLRATHEHDRSLHAFLRDARRQGAGRMLVHAAHEDIIGPFRCQDTLAGLPPVVRAVLALDRYRVVRVVGTAVLSMIAVVAIRLRAGALGVAAAKLLRRLELRRGAREVASPRHASGSTRR